MGLTPRDKGRGKPQPKTTPPTGRLPGPVPPRKAKQNGSGRRTDAMDGHGTPGEVGAVGIPPAVGGNVSGMDDTVRSTKVPMSTKEYYERKHGGGEFDLPREKKGIKVRLAEWAAKKAGKIAGNKLKESMEDKDMGQPANGEKFAVSTNLRSTGKLAAIPLVVMFVVNMIGGLKPGALEGVDTTVLQDQITDAVNTILGATAVLAALWGSASNIWKNWHRVENGVTLIKEPPK